MSKISSLKNISLAVKMSNNFSGKPFLFYLLFSLFLTLSAFAQQTEKPDELNKASIYNIIESASSRIDTVSLNQVPEINNQLKNLKFISGKLMLWGTGFERAVAMQFSKKLFLPESVTKKFRSGTRIYFENCIFQNEAGNIIKILDKIILLN